MNPAHVLVLGIPVQASFSAVSLLIFLNMENSLHEAVRLCGRNKTESSEINVLIIEDI